MSKKNKKKNITFIDIWRGLRRVWNINPKSRVTPNKKRIKNRRGLKQELRKQSEEF